MSQCRKVTAPLIQNAYATLSLPETAVLVSVSWLGKMTQTQYQEGFRVKSWGERLKLMLPWVLCTGLVATLLIYRYL